MKANELMVSDYIIVADEIARVVALFADGRISYICPDGTGGVTLEVKPIPLTAEILENNFPNVESGVIWWNNKSGELFCRVNEEGEIEVNGQFHFVHQLQHALRLCGIEKEL